MPMPVTRNPSTRLRAAISSTSGCRRNERPRQGLGSSMNNQSMRGFLAALEASGDLHRVTRTVDARFEIASVLSLREHGPAQLFERVGNHAMPVGGNLLNSRARFARALGAARDNLHGFCLTALRDLLAPVMTEQGPVQDVVHRTDIDLARLLPVPTWFEREAGPYITA